jgi:hypothetical protein
MSILLAAFGAIGGATVSLSNETILSVGFSTQTASYSLENDGDIISSTTGGGPVNEGDWISPKAAAPGDYEARATLNSGALTSGTAGSWLALTSTRTWVVERTSSGTNAANLTIEIRKGSGAALASATIVLTAEHF